VSRRGRGLGLRTVLLGSAAGACLAAFLAGSSALAATARATNPPLAIQNEVLTLFRGPGTSVSVLQQITLSRRPTTAWTVPLPDGSYRVAPQSGHVRVVAGRVVASAGTTEAAVAYRLPGRLGSVFVQNISLGGGKVAVLAAPGVYPGVGTGLTLHGEARIAGRDFTAFTGGSQGPGGVVHFSLTVGDPGRVWADGLGVVLVLWLAAGAYLGSRRLLAVLRDAGQRPDAA
jgi:hypothetical protein